jgi:hypothetical protein
MGLLDFILKKGSDKVPLSSLDPLIQEKQRELAIALETALAGDEAKAIEIVNNALSQVAGKGEFNERARTALTVGPPGSNLMEHEDFAHALETAANELNKLNAEYALDGVEETKVLLAPAEALTEKSKALMERINAFKKRFDETSALKDKKSNWEDLRIKALSAREKAEAVKHDAEKAARESGELHARLQANARLAAASSEAIELRGQAEEEKARLVRYLEPLRRSFKKMSLLSVDDSSCAAAKKFADSPTQAFLEQGGEELLNRLMQALQLMPGEEVTASHFDKKAAEDSKAKYASLAEAAESLEQASLPYKALENEWGTVRRREHALVREANEANRELEEKEKAAHEALFELKGLANALLKVEIMDA